MAEYTKISDKSFKENNGEIVFYDSTRIPGMDEIREMCECNDWEVPEEDSGRYWEIVGIIREDESECFRDNCPELGWCVMQGSCGLWDGDYACGTVEEIGDGKALLRFAFTGRGIKDVKISVSKDNGLEISAYHHDGTNCYTLRQLTPAGRKYYERWQDGEIDATARECHRKLFESRRYSRKINFYL